MIRTAMAVALAVAANVPALAHEPGTAEFNQAVRGFLLENPEILSEMQVVLEERQRVQMATQQADVLERETARIFESEHNIVLGNPEGDVTVVEFFDYNCGFCARAMRDMQAVIERDPNVRFVLKEFPILGPDSTDAHTVSLAVARIAPAKYPEFHQLLLGGDGPATLETAFATAEMVGIDRRELEAAIVPPSAEPAFTEAYELAHSLRISGTPSYVVGGEVVFGAQGAETLLRQVEAHRASLTE